jgi:hypothetical protein|tara:strand:+ start:59 stop:514 length:456 start_codon:yes stop_codon:yes gene_type:complete
MSNLINKWTEHFATNGRAHPRDNVAGTSNTVNSSFSSERGRRSIFDDNTGHGRPYASHTDELGGLGTIMNISNARVGNSGADNLASVHGLQSNTKNFTDKFFALAARMTFGAESSSVVRQMFRTATPSVNAGQARVTAMRSNVGTSRLSNL